MKRYKIAVLPGDGTGPEVVREGLKVLNAAAEKHGFGLDTTEYDFGGDRYLRTGETLPDSAVDELRGVDAIYLGAVGHPDVKPGILEHGILLRLRFEFDQYINLRPVKLYPNVYTPIKDKSAKDIDFVVVRENTAGIYTGVGGVAKRDTPDEIAVQQMIYTRREADRCLRYAFECASRRPRRKLTLCGKTNVLTHVFGLWERAFHAMGEAEYQSVDRDYAHVDAITMWMVKNPEWFDVIVTTNMFGDIITDLGAMIQGGLGVAAGGNINPAGVSMFEPIGGSAPRYTGKNAVNPLASIFAGQMMLEHLGEPAAGSTIESAAVAFLESGAIKGMSVTEIAESGFTTSKIGDAVAENVSA